MSDETRSHGFFDDFAAVVSSSVARAWFFSACVLLIVVWIPTIFVLDFDTSQLLINTATTIITFLLVALLQNSQDRSTKAVNHKLDAALHALALLLETHEQAGDIIAELRKMAGVAMEPSKQG